MEARTHQEYLRIAEHFLKTRVGDQVTPKRITDALKAAAADYRPDYWRRLRKGLELQQREAGYQKAADRIAGTQNPVTAKGPGHAKKRQKRVKRVDPIDEKALFELLRQRGDRQAQAAIVLAKHLGVRPAEMPQLITTGNQVWVTGVKKRGTDRGLDRLIEVDPRLMPSIRQAVATLQGLDGMKRVQDRIRNAGRHLWLRRRAVPSLYTWRHQMGSNLKASGLPREVQAYLMGHQSTASIDKYGRRHQGNGRAVRIRPGCEPDSALIRTNHTELPGNIEAMRVRQPEESDRVVTISPEYGYTP